MIGKGILRFHAAQWPALLASAGEPWPTRLGVHGYVTVEGRKIAKSGETAVDPFELAERFGADALRWFLLRHVPTSRDADFTLERFLEVHDKELANQLGNLVTRTTTLLVRELDGRVPDIVDTDGDLERALAAEGDALEGAIDVALDHFAPHEALGAISRFVLHANAYAERTAPWTLAKRGEARALGCSLYHLAEALRVVALALAPFLPGTSRRIAECLGLEGPAALGLARFGAPVRRASVRSRPPLFPRIASRR